MQTAIINESTYKVFSETEYEAGEYPENELFFVYFGKDLYVAAFDEEGIGRCDRADASVQYQVEQQTLASVTN